MGYLECGKASFVVRLVRRFDYIAGEVGWGGRVKSHAPLKLRKKKQKKKKKKKKKTKTKNKTKKRRSNGKTERLKEGEVSQPWGEKGRRGEWKGSAAESSSNCDCPDPSRTHQWKGMDLTKGGETFRRTSVRAKRRGLDKKIVRRRHDIRKEWRNG